MPAIRLASHYLRRKPFSLFFFFSWMRGCGPLDSRSACMGRKITTRFSGVKYPRPGSLSTAVTLVLCLQHKALCETVLILHTVETQVQSFVPDNHLEGLGSDSGLFTQRSDSLLLDGSIRTILFFFWQTDRQTDNRTGRCGPVQNAQKWSEVMWIVARRMSLCALQKAAN